MIKESPLAVAAVSVPPRSRTPRVVCGRERAVSGERRRPTNQSPQRNPVPCLITLHRRVETPQAAPVINVQAATAALGDLRKQLGGSSLITRLLEEILTSVPGTARQVISICARHRANPSSAIPALARLIPEVEDHASPHSD